MEPLWSMYDKIEKLRIDGLKTEHVRIILLGVPTRRMAHWYACREGDMQWRPIAEISEFYDDVSVFKGALEDVAPEQKATKAPTKPTAPPLKRAPDPRRPLFEEAPHSPEEADLGMMTTNVKERRSTRRFARELEFSVKSADGSFQCLTHDISTQGLSLKEPLPRWVGKKFRAKIAHGGSVVRLICEQVSTNKLRIVDADSWEVIRQWIVMW